MGTFIAIGKKIHIFINMTYLNLANAVVFKISMIFFRGLVLPVASKISVVQELPPFLYEVRQRVVCSVG